MAHHLKEFKNFPLSLPLKRIRTRLKLKPGDNSYDERIQRFFAFIDPQGRALKLKIHLPSGGIQLEGGPIIPSQSLARHLLGCSHVTLLGVTIGPDIETQIQMAEARKRNLEALILDAVGSECAEEAAQTLHKILKHESKQNSTKRFSPGYGDLNLEVQRQFFSLLKLEEMGMTLNPSGLILPQKSITAFIGWK